MKIEKGNRVKVEFTSESTTHFSGDEIKGFGVVDRCEDGYVFGRLECGKPFMCLESDCELLINPSLDFEHWFINQDFYTNMRFIHGDNLFSKDGDVYRVLPVQMAYQVWISRTKSLDNMEQCYIQIKKERDERQTQVLKLKEQLTKLGYSDQGGELMKPPLGDRPDFNLLGQYKSQVECLKVDLAGANERAQILLHKKNTMVDSLKSERDHLKKCVDGTFDIALNTNIFLPANNLYTVLERIRRALRGES